MFYATLFRRWHTRQRNPGRLQDALMAVRLDAATDLYGWLNEQVYAYVVLPSPDDGRIALLGDEPLIGDRVDKRFPLR